MVCATYQSTPSVMSWPLKKKQRKARTMPLVSMTHAVVYCMMSFLFMIDVVFDEGYAS